MVHVRLIPHLDTGVAYGQYSLDTTTSLVYRYRSQAWRSAGVYINPFFKSLIDGGMTRLRLLAALTKLWVSIQISRF